MKFASHSSKKIIQWPFEIVFKTHAAGGSRFLELLNTIMKIGLVHDVVAVENGSGFVPGDAHDARSGTLALE